MRWITACYERLRALFFRQREEAEMDEELRFHLEQETELLRRTGLEPHEARRQARIRFGGIERFKQEVRDARGTRVIDSLSRDGHYAARRLTHDWRFTVPAILVLSLGIGANTAMFSIVNRALFEPLPLVDADRLVNIYQNIGESSQPFGNSYPAYREMTAYADLFSSVAAFMFPLPVRYQADGAVMSGQAEYATSNYLEVHGLQLPLGRWFSAAEERPGAGAVAVLGHRAWSDRFGKSPSVLGRTIRINGVPATVIGVAPEGYSSSFHSGWVTDFWLPTSALATIGGRPTALENRNLELFMVRARLRRGVGVPQVQAAMTALATHLETEYPRDDPGRGISVLRADEVLFHPQLDAIVVAGASLLMVVVALVLAIACTNLATWLLVRGLGRAKEVAVRLALGASRGQVVRHLLVESVLLATTGGAVGYLLATWTIRLVELMDLPVDTSGGLDYRVLGFTLALSLLTGVIFGLAPALKATGVSLTPTLRAEGGTLDPGGRKLNLKNLLVVSQVVLSCVLLIAEGVHLRALAATQAADLGFSAQGLAFIETDARFAGYAPDEALALHDALRERLTALPGVEAATVATGPPPAWHASGEIVVDADEPVAGRHPRVRWIWAGPGYFDVLRIPLLYGRGFTDLDRRETPGVAVINDSMARRYFGTPNAVGRRFRLGDGSTSREGAGQAADLEVIGVVPDVLTSLDDTPAPLFYRSYRQAMMMTSTVVVRTAADPAGLLRPMQEAVRDLDEEVPVIRVATLSRHILDSLGPRRSLGALLGVLGALGLGLACLGLFIVVSFAVSRRAQEIGVRMTLGARPRQVIWAVSKSVAKLLAVGVTLGLALSWAALRGMGALVSKLDEAEGVGLAAAPSTDPVTFVLVVLLMTAVGLVATFLPAWRATRANPIVALRHL